MTCKRCGRCCHYIKDNKIVKCKYLVKLGKNLTACRIYSNRLGHKIDVDKICIMRENSKYDYEGCPYNTGKPILKVD